MPNRKAIVLILLSVVVVLSGCRRVSIVTNSLVSGGCGEQVVARINDNNEQSWVYKTSIWPGSTAYNNPVNHIIYKQGVVSAFGLPDVVLLSFGTNDMGYVTRGEISYESAVQSMQTLINQAVVSGANCIVLLEASHSFLGDPAIDPTYTMHMDNWFDHWGNLVGDNEYLGIAYRFLIADVSDEVHADPTKYLTGFIHLNKEGGALVAEAIVEQINRCPEGRWIFGEDQLKPGASYPDNPYMSYTGSHSH